MELQSGFKTTGLLLSKLSQFSRKGRTTIAIHYELNLAILQDSPCSLTNKLEH